MLNITRNNVNDRVSNRVDSVNGILSADFFGDLLLRIRCLTHQMCLAFAHGNHPCAAAVGSKRYAHEPAKALSARMSYRHRWQATTTARGARSAG